MFPEHARVAYILIIVIIRIRLLLIRELQIGTYDGHVSLKMGSKSKIELKTKVKGVDMILIQWHNLGNISGMHLNQWIYVNKIIFKTSINVTDNTLFFFYLFLKETVGHYKSVSKRNIQIYCIGVIFNDNSSIFQQYHGENKLTSNEMMMRSTLY